MTRCLDCGADRTADQCSVCGLTSAAAVVIVQQRLLFRTALFLVGVIAFVAASQVFPALELDSILIFSGIVFFCSLALAFWIGNRVRKREEVETIKRIYFGMVPVPWIFCGMLLMNGGLDTSRPIRVPATVVGKMSVGSWPRSRRLLVTSWREGRPLERVPVGQVDYDRFQKGDDLMIQAHKGALGIPWVDGVYRP